MTAIAPTWMHELVSADQYDLWSAEQCAGIEIVDGMIVVSPSVSKHREADLFTGVVRATAPFPVTIDLTKI